MKHKLSKYKDQNFVNESNYTSSEIEIRDETYWEFISNDGAGYYLSFSLHFFGKSINENHHDLKYRTSLVRRYYGYLLKEEAVVIAIGEDLFGNQFVSLSKGFGFLNIETGELEVLGKNFEEFSNTILKDLDYYSGASLGKAWKTEGNLLLPNERLLPKIPFILGGEFEVANLFRRDFEYVMKYNSALAKQIAEFPDGTSIKLEIE